MQNSNKITTVFLDIRGVLLSEEWGYKFRQLASEKFHFDIGEMKEQPLTIEINK